jgi:hypothetical protein
MTRPIPVLPTLSVALAAFLAATAAQMAWAQNGAVIPFDEANVFAELNDTDGDLGFHALIDGDAWTRLTIEDPGGRQILVVRAQRRLARQALSELSFESEEPELDELPPEEFFARFPEGRYTISGLTVEGEELGSTARFRHVLPAPPAGISVSGTPFDLDLIDCDEGVPVVADDDPFVISWDPVTASHPELGREGRVVITNYQLVVEREEPSLLVFSVDLPPDVTEVEVPAGFLALGEELKFEILVRERSGNQTAVESCFAFE